MCTACAQYQVSVEHRYCDINRVYIALIGSTCLMLTTACTLALIVLRRSMLVEKVFETNTSQMSTRSLCNRPVQGNRTTLSTILVQALFPHGVRQRDKDSIPIWLFCFDDPPTKLLCSGKIVKSDPRLLEITTDRNHLNVTTLNITSCSSLVLEIGHSC